MNVKVLIQKVMLSPFNAAWENETIAAVIKQLARERLGTDLTVESSRHLAAPEERAGILARVTAAEAKKKEAEMKKSFFRIPAMLMLRGRTHHATDDAWIIASFTQLAEIWPKLPDGFSGAGLVDEFLKILIFTRHTDVAREVGIRLEAISAQLTDGRSTIGDTNTEVQNLRALLESKLNKSTPS
jgi:hypothetical protein